MDLTPDAGEGSSTAGAPTDRDPEEEDVARDLGELVDPAQGFEEDLPTDAQQEVDDGYHPETGGAKYTEPDPVDEELLAREEGLGEEEEAELDAEDHLL